jgi:Lon protease-like protein
MPEGPSRDFPLFPLGLVALPGELIPLHIFEERYKTMISECLAGEREFGIVWLSDDGLREVGCACSIDSILEEMDDGRIKLLVRGTRPFRVIERQGHLPYPAGVIEFVQDREDALDPELAKSAHDAYAELVRRATDREPEPDELANMSAYAMAATVDFGLDAKQGLLDMRSENARLRLVTRLFRAAIKRLELVDRVQERARSNGKVRFGAS